MTRAAGALLSVFILASASAPAQSNGIPLTVERIFAHEHMTGAPPEGLTWSPDGKHLTYLDGGELIDLDPGTGRPHVLVSRAKLAALSGVFESEQDRDHRERYKMASYIWAPDSKHLLFDSGGRLWLYDLGNGTGVQIGFTDTLSGDDPKFSPNDENITFIRNHGLSEVRPEEIAGGAPFPLVPPPNEATSNGEVDWVYEEELDVRSNYFWSPDSKNVAFLQMDESSVPQYPITDFIPTHATVDLQRYPQPGDSNPAVRVGVVGASAGRTSWIRLPNHPGLDYVPRFGWVDRHTLWVETLSRDHKQRDLYFVDANSSQSRLVLEITDDKFLDENYDVDVEAGDIILTDWKDGHNQIYLYRYNERNPLSASDSASEVSELTQRRLRRGRGFAGGCGAPRCRLHVERRQSVGAAGISGGLRRQTQAVDRRRRLPRSKLLAQWAGVCGYLVGADGAGPAEPVPDRRQVHDVLVEPGTGALQAACAGADGGEGQGWQHALRHAADAARRRGQGKRTADPEPIRRARAANGGEQMGRPAAF